MCFRLETYGISIDKNIFLPHGRLSVEYHLAWLKIRENIEKKEEIKEKSPKRERDATKNIVGSATNTITKENTGLSQVSTSSMGSSTIIVHKFDVLFGRGPN